MSAVKMPISRLNIGHRGELVDSDELYYISNNYVLSNHAKEMIQKRNKDVDVVESIRNPILAYYNTDGTINCAINDYEYFVIATDRFPFRIITFKEKSWYSINIFEKRKMAQDGFDRKYK